jgi:chitin disaccharide deacetylase
MRVLIVTADDWGYAASYDEGIVEAATAGAVDAVSAMVTREARDPGPLLATGVEVGLHVELDIPQGRAGEEERERAGAELRRQLERFEELFGRPAAYLDGHHHVHAAPGLGALIAGVARERRLPVRSVDPRHRRLLRCQGVPTPDRLIGRVQPREPALPVELGEGGELPQGVTEWMTHPGRPEGKRAGSSSYDRERDVDLRLLLGLGDRDAWRARGIKRRAHAEALLAETGCELP